MTAAAPRTCSARWGVDRRFATREQAAFDVISGWEGVGSHVAVEARDERTHEWGPDGTCPELPGQRRGRPRSSLVMADPVLIVRLPTWVIVVGTARAVTSAVSCTGRRTLRSAGREPFDRPALNLSDSRTKSFQLVGPEPYDQPE